jgi:hypothetical protein
MPLPLLAICAIGAGVGAVVSGGLYVATHHDAKTFSWGGLGASVAGGVVAGATAPVIGTETAVGWLGAHVLVRGAIALGTSAALGGGLTKVLDNLRTGAKWTQGVLSTAATNLVLGAGLSLVGGNLFANASQGELDGIVAKAGGELEAKAPSLVKAGEAVIAQQLDQNLPKGLQGLADKALSDLGDKATSAIDAAVDAAKPKADAELEAAQAALKKEIAAPTDAASAAAAKTAVAMITPKQVVFVGTLAKGLQVSDTALASLMQDAAAKAGGPVAASADQLTEGQARYVIDQLLSKEAAQHSMGAAGRTGTALTLGKSLLGGGDDSNEDDSGSSSTASSTAAPSTTVGAPSTGGDIVIHRTPGTTVTVTVSDAPPAATGFVKALDPANGATKTN